MYEIYEYIITNMDESQQIRCRVEYNPENAYDVNHYFYNGSQWLKEFIDLNILSPEDDEEKKLFDEFITQVHDYMVHGTIWEDLEKLDDNEELVKNTYNLKITAKRI
ncbi:MAG: hypothetical protein LUG89_02495 [Methanosphaera sp.]|nr:hypothetical protein [Methanosphaera sp.]